VTCSTFLSGSLVCPFTTRFTRTRYQQTWYLRQIAPITRAEKSAGRLRHLFEHFFKSVPLASQLEPRFLRLYADAQCVRAVLHVERRRYAEALDTFAGMYDTAKQLGEPAPLAHALMNIGVELDRADRKQEAVEHLEHVRDVSFRANKAWAALIHSYLSRIYASNGDGLRFQRASETAQTLAIYQRMKTTKRQSLCSTKSKRVSKQHKSPCGVRQHCSQIMRFVVCVSIWKAWRTLDMRMSGSSETSERN
jgi:hypothetical protein